jgi:DNA-binding MarR family transcriptional regulator
MRAPVLAIEGKDTSGITGKSSTSAGTARSSRRKPHAVPAVPENFLRLPLYLPLYQSYLPTVETNADSPRDRHQPLAQELADALSGVHRATRRRIRRDLGFEPFSGAQVELLRLVAATPGIGVSAAARELNLAGNSVSTLVNQLVAKKYLRRDPSAEDRRAAVLTATDLGHERLARWADERVRLLVDELDRLDEHEVAALEAALPALRHLATGLSAPPPVPPALLTSSTPLAPSGAEPTPTPSPTQGAHTP